MAVVDSAYKYVFIDVGAEGRQSDGGVFKNGKPGKATTTTTPPAPPAATETATGSFTSSCLFLKDDMMGRP